MENRISTKDFLDRIAKMDDKQAVTVLNRFSDDYDFSDLATCCDVVELQENTNNQNYDFYEIHEKEKYLSVYVVISIGQCLELYDHKGSDCGHFEHSESTIESFLFDLKTTNFWCRYPHKTFDIEL